VSNLDTQVKDYATDSSQYSLDELLSGSSKTSDMQLVYGSNSQTRKLQSSESNFDYSSYRNLAAKNDTGTYYNDCYDTSEKRCQISIFRYSVQIEAKNSFCFFK